MRILTRGLGGLLAGVISLLFVPEALAHRAVRADGLNVTLEIVRPEAEGHEHADEHLEPGAYEIRLHLQDATKGYAPVDDARVEVLLVREGRPGERFPLAHRGSGEYRGRVEVSEPGAWTLRAEIARGSEGIVTAEFPLEIASAGDHSHGEGGFTWPEWLMLATAGLAALWILRQIVRLRSRASRAAEGP